MTEEQTIIRWRPGAGLKVFSLAGVLCLLLASLLALIQVKHIDPIGSNTSVCPLCVVLHTAAPVTPAAPVVVLVAMGQSEAVLRPLAGSRFWRPRFFTRPPPAGC
ncbi:MAG: hypothetical protein ACRD25_06290 [Terracidiphilus sp.]